MPLFRRIALLAAATLALLPATAPAQTRPTPPVQLPPAMRVPAPATIRPAPIPIEKQPFAAEIAAFEARDRVAKPVKGGVLFLGSSSIRMWTDLAKDFPGHNVINRGFGGSTIPDSIRYVDRIVTPYAPKTVVFYAGDNDLEAGHTPEEVFSDFQVLVGKIRLRLPQTRILFVSIKPSLSRWRLIDGIRATNALVRDHVATDPLLGYVDIVPGMTGPDGRPRPELFLGDGLHMTRAGYDIWRAAVGKAMKWKLPPLPARPPAHGTGKPPAKPVSGPVRSSKAGH
ncbi:lysophospholipase L1-like esterase [Sphingomonas kyeonggiensis]|uniref:SGNH/GDSL hydrolase family protein n=1 Tax=Sphingomonas kyeonggiensis TaxID=1268553 RepID=UPI00277DF1C6|nr:SGNH/GDSL hydrolase family protein [Sphingomonas kyeonggiensis]MDQ0248130.1 lysophospholipase L1-like esterase [Sphingomonas kyeonggiensis]